jgi:hypothetical protein
VLDAVDDSCARVAPQLTQLREQLAQRFATKQLASVLEASLSSRKKVVQC